MVQAGDHAFTCQHNKWIIITLALLCKWKHCSSRIQLTGFPPPFTSHQNDPFLLTWDSCRHQSCTKSQSVNPPHGLLAACQCQGVSIIYSALRQICFFENTNTSKCTVSISHLIASKNWNPLLVLNPHISGINLRVVTAPQTSPVCLSEQSVTQCRDEWQVENNCVYKSSNQTLILLLLNTTSLMCANLFPGSTWRPRPVWCSGWEGVLVIAVAPAPQTETHQVSNRKLGDVWLIGSEWEESLRKYFREDRRGDPQTLLLYCCLTCLIRFLLVYGTDLAHYQLQLLTRLLARPSSGLLHLHLAASSTCT